MKCPALASGLLVALAVAVTTAAAQAPARPPNILVILTDDLGYGDTSAYRPNGDVRTPAIDHLVGEGMKFTAMRANATVCSPSRAALMTGRYADRVGIPGLVRSEPANSWGYMDRSVPTIADLLHRAGYHTAIVGKWNLGLTPPATPNERGFDLFHGFLDDMMDSYTTHLRHGQNYLRLNHEVVNPVGHATAIFTDWACDYLRGRASESKPFFLYLAYNAPHFPIEPPPEALARVQRRAPGLDPKRALNVAHVEYLDEGIGRVLQVLKETGLEQNTLVFFTSDNGGSLPHAQNNDPWRGGKQDHYDGGLRVPFAVRWPGHVAPGSSSDYPGLLFDIFATSLEVAGAAVPRDTDAVSLLPVLRGERVDARSRELYFVRREGGNYLGKSYEAIIRGDWKLMQNDPFSPLELYNLKDDPQEKHNLVTERPAIVRDLKNALRAHIQRGGAAPWEPPPRQ